MNCEDLFVIDPSRPETIPEAEQLLENQRCVGIKMHPFQHEYESRKLAGAVFEVAERHNALTLTHSGYRSGVYLAEIDP